LNDSGVMYLRSITSRRKFGQGHAILRIEWNEDIANKESSLSSRRKNNWVRVTKKRKNAKGGQTRYFRI